MKNHFLRHLRKLLVYTGWPEKQDYFVSGRPDNHIFNDIFNLVEQVNRGAICSFDDISSQPDLRQSFERLIDYYYADEARSFEEWVSDELNMEVDTDSMHMADIASSKAAWNDKHIFQSIAILQQARMESSQPDNKTAVTKMRL